MAYVKKTKFKTPVFNETPSCCDSATDYAEWQYLERQGQEKQGGFCRDCQSGFQLQMIKEGRCQYPEVVFVSRKNRDGERYIYGRLPEGVENVNGKN